MDYNFFIGKEVTVTTKAFTEEYCDGNHSIVFEGKCVGVEDNVLIFSILEKSGSGEKTHEFLRYIPMEFIFWLDVTIKRT